MNNKMRQEQLTAELREASDKYYNEGITLMSDLEFDKKIEELKRLEAESGIILAGSPTVNVGAAVKTELEQKTHEYPALSADKEKYKDKGNLLRFLEEFCDNCANLSWKMDGLTVVLTYNNGELESAVTRGNGIVGSDVTHNAVFFKGIPHKIPYNEHLVVRGEAVMTTKEFERVNTEAGGIYENPRNLASATIQMLDANESRKREICFYAFELVCPEPVDDEDEMMYPVGDKREWADLRNMSDRLVFLKTLGFNVVENTNVTKDTILDEIEVWKDKLPSLGYPTDGLVFTANNLVKGWALGSTGHHPRWMKALKWTDETETTTIRDIEWSVGKTGAITPVAIFDTVRLGLGSNVERASLHNLSIMKKLGVMIGSKAEVYLANMIIPQVASCEGGTDEIAIPDVCPICKKPTRIENNNGVEVLYCDNKECSARQLGNLMNTFSKDGLFVKGLGESQIVDLLEAGLVDATPISFYNLANEDRANSVYPKESEFAEKVTKLWNKDGWGKKKWENLVIAIESSRKTTLQKFLYSLNIPLLGNDLSKKLSKYWNGDISKFISFIEDADTMNGYRRENIVNELTQIDGIGEEKATNIANWAAEVVETGKWADDIKALISELKFPEADTTVPTGNSLEGMTFVITGSVHEYKNRDEFKASVEARGGKVAGSVSAKTSFLVNNDVESTSGKNQKAKELNIPIISEDEFIERFGK